MVYCDERICLSVCLSVHDHHTRRKGSVVGGIMASAEHEPISWPEPPAGSRGRAPGHGVRGLKLKAFWSLDVQRSRQI